ncbi:MAG: FIST domain containing protein, partial [Rhodocyclaceae bacterium]
MFKTQHFECLDERLVVTAADAGQRIVKEINGLPAASEYARISGVSVEDLRPDAFAAVPVVVVINGSDYVRSIRSVNPDGSLTFYCAIEEGLVFRVARATDLLANVQQTFQDIR